MPCARSLWIFCARSLFRDLCIRILYDALCKISVCGFLVQDLSVKMSAPCRISICRSVVQSFFFRIFAQRSCIRSIGARSPYADFLRKISVSKHLHQGRVGPLVQDPCMSVSSTKCCVKISSAQSCKTTCVKPLSADPLCILVCQDLCIRVCLVQFFWLVSCAIFF